MPRFPRSYIQTSYFHVITQGLNKMYIFNSEDDIAYYIKLMKDLHKEYSIQIISYCIMNNHAHILIKTESIKELGKYMHRLNTMYAMHYNKKNNRVGYVFRDRYKAEGIYSEEHLYNCMKYIYNNPVKAGICKKPEDYKYSNYITVPETEDMKSTFIDVENENEYIEYINNYLNNNNIKLEKILNNKNELKELIRTLKMEYGVSLRKIAKQLNIGREIVRKIYNE